MTERPRITRWDRFLIGIFPRWGLERVRARAAVRHYEAAQGGRRTSGWHRSSGDANAANRPALISLRELSRDLRRNNGWARRGVQTIVNNTVGWGIMPKPKAGRSRARNTTAIHLWNDWADSTMCDWDGRMNFYGLQRLAIETIVESGEVLILRQPATTADGLPVPMRLQVLEPDYLDTNRTGGVAGGGQIIDGVEFDKRGQRVAYWLFTQHPGALRLGGRFDSVRVPADRVLHIYRVDRAGQVRGVPWLASAISRLKDLDDFEDAELMQQKVAACFGAFVSDVNGDPASVGEQDESNEHLEHLQPGHIAYLSPGQEVTFAQPPRAQDGAFSERVLRRIAVGLGVTYEDLTGDYSKSNYSSSRMARLAHWQNVYEWREHMVIPTLCNGVWRWVMEYARDLEGWTAAMPVAQWAAPPMPVLEPDREGLAYTRLVRIGAMTWPQMVRELGYDPVEQLDEIEEFNADVDKRKIVLDIDPRKTNASGQQQSSPPPTDKPEGDDDGSVDVDLSDDESAAPAADAPAAPTSDDDDDEEPAAATKKQAAAEVKVFAYHQPFMRVKEIRESIGLSGDIEDADLFANEFVAKHSGETSGDEGADDNTDENGSRAHTINLELGVVAPGEQRRIELRSLTEE